MSGLVRREEESVRRREVQGTGRLVTGDTKTSSFRKSTSVRT